MTRIALLTLSSLLMAGCAATPDKQVADDTKIVCAREYRVGSNIPVVTCEAQRTDEERRRMMDEVKSNVRPMPSKVPAGGAGG